MTGVILAAAIILLGFGFNNVRNWGLLLARPAAPFAVLSLSPAPMLIVVGIVLGSAFLVWTRKREADQQTPLLAPEVVDSPQERAAVIAMFTIVAMEAAINFAVPLYIQIVQGRSAFQTAIAMMPFNLTVFFTAILIVRLYNRLTPRQIARYAFLVVTAGALWLAFVVPNDWSTFRVLRVLVTVGLGQGALVTLLFNVLVTSAPQELSGDVGSARGVTQNLASAVGTAVMSTLVVGLLSPGVLSSLTDNPIITTELQAQVDLDNINFLSTEREKGKSPYQAILEGGVSKMRPVCMVVLTTVLGMIPLLLDPFFGAMAAGLMFGLAFATVLCLIGTPVLYAIFFGVRETAAAVPEAQSMRQPVEVKGNVAPVAQTNPPI